MVLLISYVLSALASTALYSVTGTVSARRFDGRPIPPVKPHVPKGFNRNRLAASLSSDDAVPGAGVKNFTFSNPAASAFYVDGKSIPDVEFDVGPSWAGLLPISGDTNETRKLFFWFFPPGPLGKDDTVTMWMNGGPGCSSLLGLLQENGPFSWAPGQAGPTVNEYSWTNLSSMLYIEQPVGTGFSQGVPNIVNEDDLAAQFVGFLEQFLEVFSELKGKKTYLTGESYAGAYIPYIANYIYENKAPVDLSLQGIWMGDPLIGWDVVQYEIPAVDFVHKYEHVFAFNQTFLAYLDEQNGVCNYAGYLDKYLKYPPTGLLPLPGQSVELDPGCDLWTEIYDATFWINPVFNAYRIFDMYPAAWDVLSYPNISSVQSPIYFDRDDVKQAIHAPTGQTWAECAGYDPSKPKVFPNGDASLPSALTVLPNVIEKSSRSVIAHGLGDFVLIAEGARAVLQNMTWGGMQGFQQAPEPDSFILDDAGAMGTVQIERNLAYYEVALSGHKIPHDAPWAAYQMMEWLLGMRDDP